MSTPDRRDELIGLQDGMLPEGERARVRAEAEASGQARADLEALARADAWLRSAFAPSGTAAAGLKLPAAEPAAAPRRGGSWVWWAIAAMVVLGVGNVWFWQMRPSGSNTMVARSGGQVYRDLVEQGFRPDMFCPVGDEFVRLMQRQYGVPLMAARTPTVELLGWMYPGNFSRLGLTGRTGVLLARAEGKPVVVLLERAENARAPRVKAGRGLRVFSRELNGLKMFEITPLERSMVIDEFRPATPALPGG
jgi:hypothetical protein